MSLRVIILVLESFTIIVEDINQYAYTLFERNGGRTNLCKKSFFFSKPYFLSYCRDKNGKINVKIIVLIL